jgi:hypothetical protein
MNLRLPSSVALFVAPVLVTLLSATPAHAARKPVKDVLLFRADASVAPGSYQLEVNNADGDSSSTYAFALGPRLGLNLGYAPSRLIRLGFGTAAAFSMTIAEDGDIPSAEVDGWARWTIGPSVGFRFGPKVPIELDIALNFATFQTLGSQVFPLQGSPSSFDALARRYGMTSTALLLWRPGGAADAFAFHAGLESTWGMDGGASSGTMLLQSLLLGISVGL